MTSLVLTNNSVQAGFVEQKTRACAKQATVSFSVTFLWWPDSNQHGTRRTSICSARSPPVSDGLQPPRLQVVKFQHQPETVLFVVDLDAEMASEGQQQKPCLSAAALHHSDLFCDAAALRGCSRLKAVSGAINMFAAAKVGGL
jgi:hypothetical protein